MPVCSDSVSATLSPTSLTWSPGAVIAGDAGGGWFALNVGSALALMRVLVT